MHSVRRRSVALAAAGAVVVGMLAGCVGGDPKPTPTSKPSATPLYSSDKEALAAAKDAYARYVEVSNEVAHGGWADLSPLKDVATGDALKADEKSGKANHSKGLKVVGDITGDLVRIQKVDTRAVDGYACLDVSGTRIVDQQGSDRTSQNRTEIVPFEVDLVMEDQELKVGRLDVWSGDSFC